MYPCRSLVRTFVADSDEITSCQTNQSRGHQRINTSVCDQRFYLVILCHLKTPSKRIFLYRLCVEQHLPMTHKNICFAPLPLPFQYLHSQGTRIKDQQWIVCYNDLSLPLSFSRNTQIQRYLPMITDQCLRLSN